MWSATRRNIDVKLVIVIKYAAFLQQPFVGGKKNNSELLGNNAEQSEMQLLRLELFPTMEVAQGSTHLCKPEIFKVILQIFL